MNPNENPRVLQPEFQPLSEAFIYASPERIDEMSFTRTSAAFDGFDSINGRRGRDGQAQSG